MSKDEAKKKDRNLVLTPIQQIGMGLLISFIMLE